MQTIYNPKDEIQVAAVVNELVRQFENTSSVTLTNSVTSTVVYNPKVVPSSVVNIDIPRTPGAAAVMLTTYVSSVGNGQFTITHASATTTRTFDYVIHGV